MLSKNQRFNLPMPEDIKFLRNKKGYTQTELGKFSGFSQSLIARIEGGNVNPRLSTIRKILDILYIHSAKAADISTTGVIFISQEEKIGKAIEIMRKKSISQIPVRDRKTRKLNGLLSENIIMNYLTNHGHSSINDKISELALEDIEFVAADLLLPDVEKKLLSKPALFLRLKDEKIGIITKSDLIQYYR